MSDTFEYISRYPERCNRLIVRALVVVFGLLSVTSVSAQSERNADRRKENNSTVMIAAGRPDTSLMEIANDLSIVLKNAEDGFRVVPVVGDGAEGNVRDLILLRNIDLALTDLTVLKWMNQSTELSAMLSREVAHVVTLFPDKLSLLAKNSISDITELDGKRVSAGFEGSTESTHAKHIFKMLNIEVQLLDMASVDSADALSKGEIDAFLCFCLTSPSVYQRVMFDPDLHILPIPIDGSLQQDYRPAALSHEEFPAFIKKGETVNTLAVDLALVTYNWQKGSPRYALVSKFVERMLDNLDELRRPPRHKGWQTVQVNQELETFPRFAAVSEWQNSRKDDALQEMRVAFGEFLNQWAPSNAPAAATEQTQLFEEFLAWQETTRR